MVVQGVGFRRCHHPSFEVSAPRFPARELYQMWYDSCMTKYDEDDVGPCDRCGDIVGTETFMTLGDQNICEICWDDM